jgi:hypothetical protein
MYRSEELTMGILTPKPKITLGTSDVGTHTEMFIVERLTARGYVVLAPFGSQRYDLVIEDGDGQFWRLQCKTARLNSKRGYSYIEFNTSTINSHRKNNSYKEGDVDYYAVFLPQNQNVYLVPFAHAGKHRGYLRLEPRQHSRDDYGEIKLAENYEL